MLNSVYKTVSYWYSSKLKVKVKECIVLLNPDGSAGWSFTYGSWFKSRLINFGGMAVFKCDNCVKFSHSLAARRSLRNS